MFYNIPEKIIIPSTYIDLEDLGLYVDDNREITQMELDEIRLNLEKIIGYLFTRISGYRDYVTDDQMLDMHVEVLKGFILLSIDNISSMKNIESEAVEGLGIDDMLIFHTNRIRDVYKLHVITLQSRRDLITPKKPISSNRLKIEVNSMLMDMECEFLKLVDKMQDLSLEDTIDLLVNGFKGVLIKHVDDISCFRLGKTGKIKGKTFEEIVDEEINRFKENYITHKDRFKC